MDGIYARIRIVAVYTCIIDDDNRRRDGGGDDYYGRTVFFSFLKIAFQLNFFLP